MVDFKETILGSCQSGYFYIMSFCGYPVGHWCNDSFSLLIYPVSFVAGQAVRCGFVVLKFTHIMSRYVCGFLHLLTCTLLCVSCQEEENCAYMCYLGDLEMGWLSLQGASQSQNVRLLQGSPTVSNQHRQATCLHMCTHTYTHAGMHKTHVYSHIRVHWHVQR